MLGSLSVVKPYGNVKGGIKYGDNEISQVKVLD